MNERCGSCAILFEKGGDCAPGCSDILGLQEAICVSMTVLISALSRKRRRRSVELSEEGTYSFCASMITSTLSLVEAVDGWTPMSSLNAFAILIYLL